MHALRKVLILILCIGQIGFAPQLMASSGPQSAHNPSITRIQHNNYEVIYWGQSKFYRYPCGKIVADYYTPQTIDDMASLMHHLRYSRIAFTPVGHPGSIPAHLRDYAFWRLAEHGVQVTNHNPTSGIIYWGQSTFYYDNYGNIYAQHYTHQTIDDMARLLHALGYRSIQLIPQGYVGSIPSHLRGYAINKFNQYGIHVTDPGQGGGNKPKKKKGGPKKNKKPDPEELFFDIFMEILENS